VRYRVLFILPKRQNFVDYTVNTVRTVLTWQGMVPHVAGDVEWTLCKGAKLAGYVVDTWKNGLLTRGIWVESNMVPRSPVVGCHMESLQSIKGGVVRGGRTPDLWVDTSTVWQGPGYQPARGLFLNLICLHIYLS
jgi:hypothetical protein